MVLWYNVGMKLTSFVATQAHDQNKGLQGGRAEREAHESHLMLPGV
jgi:hypothetical protein